MSKIAHTDFDISEEVSAMKLKPVPPARPNASNLADLHRREAHNCKQRMADAKRHLKADLATYAKARKEEKARHEVEMMLISEGEASARERTAESIAEDERLSRYNLAALDALAE